MDFAVEQEIKKYLRDSEVVKHDNNACFETIVALRRRGKNIRAVLMKNDFVAWIIKSPLWRSYESGHLTPTLLAAGLRYAKEYQVSKRDNRSKQIFEVMGTGFSVGHKEPKQYQIYCSGNVQKIKDLLHKEGTHFIKEKNEYYCKNYPKIVELYLEQEKTYKQMKLILGLGDAAIKERMVEALELIDDFYNN